MNARILPLKRAITDLRAVEGIIDNDDMGSEEISIIFQEIIRKMFDDLKIEKTYNPNADYGIQDDIMIELKVSY